MLVAGDVKFPVALRGPAGRLAAVALLLTVAGCTAGAVTGSIPDPSIYEQVVDEGVAIPAVQSRQLDPRFARRTVSTPGNIPNQPGTIVVDTANRYLYLVQADGTSIRYGIGVGRDGFSWSGEATIKAKRSWPDWFPPKEMVARDPLAAEWANGMPGGPGNPLGARALYLFEGDRDTLYRLHGTMDASSIGKAVSSGCVRLLNQDVIDLYNRVPVGTKVVVLADGFAGRPLADYLFPPVPPTPSGPPTPPANVGI
jgi:lipoprotein-anchoring transpeptidase ErfK/SrfK